MSPSLINSGTLISAPVSMVASLLAPVAVSPLTPGSVAVTLTYVTKQNQESQVGRKSMVGVEKLKF